MHGHRQVRVDRRFPQRPELRFAVQLTRLQRDADLHHARMVFVLCDLAHCTGDVVGIHPDSAAEPVTELIGLQPARHHHLVVRGMQGAAQMPVRHDAAAHRVQDRHVDPALRKQFVGNEFRIRSRILAIRSLAVGCVLAAGRPVPVHLVVREPAALERLAQQAP